MVLLPTFRKSLFEWTRKCDHIKLLTWMVDLLSEMITDAHIQIIHGSVDTRIEPTTWIYIFSSQQIVNQWYYNDVSCVYAVHIMHKLMRSIHIKENTGEEPQFQFKYTLSSLSYILCNKVLAVAEEKRTAVNRTYIMYSGVWTWCPSANDGRTSGRFEFRGPLTRGKR